MVWRMQWAFQPLAVAFQMSAGTESAHSGQKVLEPAQAAVAIGRALARQNPDALTPGMAMSPAMVGGVPEASNRPEEVLASFPSACGCSRRFFNLCPRRTRS
jgi:hypothetical protein